VLPDAVSVEGLETGEVLAAASASIQGRAVRKARVMNRQWVSFQGWRVGKVPGQRPSFVRALGVARQRVYIGGGCAELGGQTPPQTRSACPGRSPAPAPLQIGMHLSPRGSREARLGLRRICRGGHPPGAGVGLAGLGVVPTSSSCELAQQPQPSARTSAFSWGAPSG
jgi:hypothetical protein